MYRSYGNYQVRCFHLSITYPCTYHVRGYRPLRTSLTFPLRSCQLDIQVCQDPSPSIVDPSHFIRIAISFYPFVECGQYWQKKKKSAHSRLRYFENIRPTSEEVNPVSIALNTEMAYFNITGDCSLMSLTLKQRQLLKTCRWMDKRESAGGYDLEGHTSAVQYIHYRRC